MNTLHTIRMIIGYLLGMIVTIYPVYFAALFHYDRGEVGWMVLTMLLSYPIGWIWGVILMLAGLFS